MSVINIAEFEDSVVIHFDTDDKRINAYTLASTLVSLADAAKAANTAINSGCEVEVLVEALGPGSFRAQIRAIYSRSKDLLAGQVVLGIVIGILGNYIYERTLSLDNKVTVEVKTDEVVIQKGQDRVVVPRNVYDATRKAEKNPEFIKAMSKTFETVSSDDKVKGIGLVPHMDSPPPEIIVSKEALQALVSTAPDDPDARTIYEQVELQILKAILEKSRRKWEFMWRGVKISAPVTHEHFYINFFAHHITIAPGDVLSVKLAIKQTKDINTGVYTNIGYEVIEVYEHQPRIRQIPLISDNENS